jgi:hypothetical protein
MMSLDRLLAVVGILIGIPGVLVLFLTANQTLAIFAGFLAVALLAGAFYIRQVLNASPYSFSEAKVTLAFPVDHQTAVLSKEYKIVPNFHNLRQLEHKNIAADGPIANIRWNDVAVPADRISHRLGEYEIRIDLPFAPKRWSEFRGKLSYECEGSFNGNPESIMYCVDFPTRRACITVEFPANKPCRSAYARIIRGAGEMPIQDPVRSDDGSRIELNLERPPHGAQYVIYWMW